MDFDFYIYYQILNGDSPQLIRAACGRFAWVFESLRDRRKLLKLDSDSPNAKRLTTGVSVSGPRR